jgi:putative hemolysin
VIREPIRDIQAGSLEVRLACSSEEIEAAKSLRYRVFYDEMGAKPSPEMAARRQDFDAFDDICDHLLVIDHDRQGADAVVGTYRLLRRSVAERHDGFYTADEYDIAAVLRLPGEILELGRSCVDAGYRNRATMTLLWRGNAAYVDFYDITLMFGCGSLHGTDPQELALPLSYLYHHHMAPPELRPVALAERYVEMNLMPADQINARAALKALPPLVKGYLRLGGFIGKGAVIDLQWNSVDVSIVVKTDLVTQKYRDHLT